MSKPARDGPVSAETTAAAIRPVAETGGLSLIVQTGRPFPLRTDREALSEMVWDFVDNAIKFTETRGVRRARATAPGGAVPPSRSPSRTPAAGSRRRSRPRSVRSSSSQCFRGRAPMSGGGLGLEFSQKLGALLDGRMAVRSEVGHGGSCRLWLPNVRP